MVYAHKAESGTVAALPRDVKAGLCLDNHTDGLRIPVRVRSQASTALFKGTVLDVVDWQPDSSFSDRGLDLE